MEAWARCSVLIARCEIAVIYLVACVKKKSDNPAPARDLYTSAWFKYARVIAERESTSWFILSAKHKLISPDQQLEPYDMTLKTMWKREREAWADIVLSQLKEMVRRGDTVVILAPKDYFQLIRSEIEKKCIVVVPMEGMGIGEQLHWLKENAAAADLNHQLDSLYDVLYELGKGLGGPRLMAGCTGRMEWPTRGVYFFFEPGELHRGSRVPRVVRVGTHGLKEGGKSSLWGRLRAHRGSSIGGGNHRGSVFRSHVGSALIEAGLSSIEATQWGIGSSARRDIRDLERPLEEKVSEYIGRMQLLWLAVEDEPGPYSDRAYLERNAIALLSAKGSRVDPPSPTWLGRHSTHPLIRKSGLWNVDFIGAPYESRFLEVLEYYAVSTVETFGIK